MNSKNEKVKAVFNSVRNFGKTYFKRINKNFDWVLTSDLIGVVTSILVVIIFIPVVVVAGVVALIKSLFN